MSELRKAARLTLHELKVSWAMDDDDASMADRDNAVNALTYALSKPDERDAAIRQLEAEASQLREQNTCLDAKLAECDAVLRLALERLQMADSLNDDEFDYGYYNKAIVKIQEVLK
jgi:hypothetical protein